MNQNKNRSLWIDYLRSFITILVVAHHAAMAYPLFAHFDKQAYINSTHPVVDSVRSVGFDIFIQFNDIFFMSLMFFIGGIFLIKSIGKKGKLFFIRDRFFRLFLPFLLLGTFLMLLAYIPSFYISRNSFNITDYLKDFFTTEKWPVGPPWFIWLLFVFNLIFALFSSVFEKVANKTEKLLSILKNKPFLFLAALFALTWAVYVPLSYTVGMGTWTGIGPFDFQLDRILLYFGYFSLGIIIGRSDFNSELFSSESKLIKRWPIWTIFSVVMFALLLLITQYKNTTSLSQSVINPFGLSMLYYSIYTASTVLINISFICLFKRFFNNKLKVWSFFSDNAYLIYLLHYVFVTWSQFLLLKLEIPIIIKFTVTTVASLGLSLGLSILLRKIPLLKKYL